ncbi:MAG: hypothetical protein NVSMB19_15670 [Vulcanimicrobiaceae bacterium]
MEPDIAQLREMMALDAASQSYENASPERLRRRPSGAGRALELALAAIETLRDRGSVTGEELCRLAVLLGFDEMAVLRAWNTRCEFDVEARAYAPNAPIAIVLLSP